MNFAHLTAKFARTSPPSVRLSAFKLSNSFDFDERRPLSVYEPCLGKKRGKKMKNKHIKAERKRAKNCAATKVAL